MINGILRGIVVLWAAFFALLGFQELVSPTPYFAMFDMAGIDGSANAINAVRADLSAFFLIAAGGALVGALVPGWQRALLVPAALFGTACVGRAIGLGIGDRLTVGITQAMIAEAVSTALMLGALWQFSRPTAAAVNDGAKPTP
jgi:hypothetical protein